MRPPWGVGGLCALALVGAEVRPAAAAWDNLFQACCHPCRGTSASSSGTGACYETRAYYEPVTTYRVSYSCEPVVTYRYRCCYDPCTCRYQAVACPVACGQRLRARCCAVRTWVRHCCRVVVPGCRPCCTPESVPPCCPAPPAPTPAAGDVLGPPIPTAPPVPAPPAASVPALPPAPVPAPPSAASSSREVPPRIRRELPPLTPPLPSPPVPLDRVAATAAGGSAPVQPTGSTLGDPGRTTFTVTAGKAPGWR